MMMKHTGMFHGAFDKIRENSTIPLQYTGKFHKGQAGGK